MSQEGFWDDPNAQSLAAELSVLKSDVDTYVHVQEDCDEIDVYFDLLEEGESVPEDELSARISAFAESVDRLELKALLSGKYDSCNCVFGLYSGAGGTDAQDWTAMLLRMYTRFFEQQGYQYEIIDQTVGDEAGIKSVVLLVKGTLAYGYLKAENGVHRLVRLSPFNANNKRQTSFAAVEVMPEIEQDNSAFDIDPKDLRIDTYRASGAGGQHVNKTDSAVRITHVPTGLVAQSQHSRSQGANKEMAMTLLTSRLAILMEEQNKQQLDELREGNKDVAWGNQIRSYVFHPYKLVKDLRTSYEVSDVQGVMDGDLMGFIEATLRQQIGEEGRSE